MKAFQFGKTTAFRSTLALALIALTLSAGAVSSRPARAADPAQQDLNDMAALGYVPPKLAGEPIRTHWVDSTYTACASTPIRQLEPRGGYSDGFSEEEVRCAQSTEKNLMPVTGSFRRGFQAVDEYLRAAAYAGAVGHLHADMLGDNRITLQKLRLCLSALPSWDAPASPDCANLVRLTRARFVQAANEARASLALAALGSALRPGFMTHPEEVVNTKLEPPQDFPMPPRWKEVPRPPLSDAETKAAADAIRAELRAIRERNLGLLSERMKQFADQPDSGAYRLMKTRYDKIAGSTVEDLAHWADSGWQNYVQAELGRFRERKTADYLETLLYYPFLAYVPAGNPGPAQFVTAIDQTIRNIDERAHRITKLIFKVEHGDSNQTDAIDELTKYPFLNNETLKARPQDCAIAQAVLEHNQNRGKQRDLAFNLGVAGLGYFGAPTWALLGLDAAYVGKGIYDARTQRIRDSLDAYTTVMGPDETQRARLRQCTEGKRALENKVYEGMVDDTAGSVGITVLGSVVEPVASRIGLDASGLKKPLQEKHDQRINALGEEALKVLELCEGLGDPNSSPVTLNDAAASAKTEGELTRNAAATYVGQYIAIGVLTGTARAAKKGVAASAKATFGTMDRLLGQQH